MEKVLTEISIVTLNCWGLKYISKLRRERLTEIGRQLAAADPQPHIVALQECWTQEDYHSIRRETRFILPYGKFYHSGAFGGGLAILSRWPIEESTMFRYPLNGRPTAFFRGDWFVGKGVACAKIRYGPEPKQVVEVFNTHTHAPYEHGPNDSYLCHRMAQSWEMSKLLRGAAERGHLVIGVGDFNMVPLSLEHRLITAHAPVRDVWRVLHPESSLGPADHPAEKARRRPIPTAEFNIRENGAASDGPYNTWRWTRQQQKLLGPGKPAATIPPDTIDARGKRLDYVFAGSGDIAALNGGWVVRHANVGMMMRHPKLGCSLSDHFAVEATLAFHPLPKKPSKTRPLRPTAIPNPRPDSETIVNSLEPDIADADTSTINTTPIPSHAFHNGTYLHIQSPTPTPSEDFSTSASKHPDAQLLSFPHANPQYPTPSIVVPLPSTVYDEILATLHKYVRRERSQRRWRARHFFASAVVTVACLVGVWFSPRNYVAFVLMLVSSLSLVAGTIDGLLALLFFKSELRALKEFEWEIINAKAINGAAPIQDEEIDEDDGDDEEGW
ncbi:Endonuclease/exonuclease/phosphatase [Lasiosphaeris hirsuta]|uniref:Endonuclease/exonuclease/phosphatase n=1 Tax=Lasiosphaeris hirsuta TaxID=260670 RepID=A0AA40BC37_9PEZI|nr:Endonuclease/exonuclease/phosphatase [Lasiosphaeris hirsuta]